MTASTTWAICGIDTLGTDLVLRQVLPWSSSGAVVPADVSATFAPLSGAVGDLLDGTSSECVFALEAVRLPGFSLTFTFSESVELLGFRFRQGSTPLQLNRHSVVCDGAACTLNAIRIEPDGLSAAPTVPLLFSAAAGELTQSAFPSNLGAVACAAHDSWWLAGATPSGGLYRTTDHGVSWDLITTVSNRNWHACAISSDGLTAVAVAAVIPLVAYISRDAGVNWSAISGLPLARADVCALSADGNTILIAGGTDYGYLSTDGGYTWAALTSAGSRAWRGCAVTGEGDRLFLADSFGSLLSSVDGGATWSQLFTQGLRACSVSADGRVLLVGSTSLHLSINAGGAWTDLGFGSGRNWYVAGVSADGNVLAAADERGLLVVSVDRGLTWTIDSAAAGASWIGCSVSPNGLTVLGAKYPSGGIWVRYGQDSAYVEPQVLSSVALVERGVDAEPVVGMSIGMTDCSVALDAEFGGRGRLYGSVSRKGAQANVPLKRRVRLHRSRDGMLARETWSKADGSYEFRDLNPRYEYDVIAWDHELQEFSTVANNQLAEVEP